MSRSSHAPAPLVSFRDQACSCTCLGLPHVPLLPSPAGSIVSQLHALPSDLLSLAKPCAPGLALKGMMASAQWHLSARQGLPSRCLILRQGICRRRSRCRCASRHPAHCSSSCHTLGQGIDRRHLSPEAPVGTPPPPLPSPPHIWAAHSQQAIRASGFSCSTAFHSNRTRHAAPQHLVSFVLQVPYSGRSPASMCLLP